MKNMEWKSWKWWKRWTLVTSCDTCGLNIKRIEIRLKFGWKGVHPSLEVIKVLLPTASQSTQSTRSTPGNTRGSLGFHCPQRISKREQKNVWWSLDISRLSNCWWSIWWNLLASGCHFSTGGTWPFALSFLSCTVQLEMQHDHFQLDAVRKLRNHEWESKDSNF